MGTAHRGFPANLELRMASPAFRSEPRTTAMGGFQCTSGERTAGATPRKYRPTGGRFPLRSFSSGNFRRYLPRAPTSPGLRPHRCPRVRWAPGYWPVDLSATPAWI